jgi:hypothetical protein
MCKFEIAGLSLQVLTLLAVTATLWVYYQQLRTMTHQLQGSQSEMASRMRPWVGQFGFGYDDGPEQLLYVLLRNVGPLPAQRAHLEIVLLAGDEASQPINWREERLKALVPGEDGNYAIPLARYPQFSLWRDEQREIVVCGTISYSLDARTFFTKFECALRFGEARDETGSVKTRWRNVEVQ